jgi:hypothetical protein
MNGTMRVGLLEMDNSKYDDLVIVTDDEIGASRCGSADRDFSGFGGQTVRMYKSLRRHALSYSPIE